MKSEIAWLMEAFLEEDYKTVRKMIKDRMAEVTESLTQPPIGRPFYNAPTQQPSFDQNISQQALVNQSPSMQRIMQQNPDLVPKVPPPVTPAAAAALAARQQLIMGASNEKPENGRKGPRKM